MDSLLVQPHITSPLPPASPAFQVCPDQTPMLLSIQLTFLLQPFIDLPLLSPPRPSMFRKQLQVLREKASLPFAPISLSSSSPHLFGIPLCWLCGGPFSPLSINTGPSVPEPGSSVPGHRRWKTSPAVPSHSSRGNPCPLSSHSPQWVHLTIYESHHPL